ncbi:hypothetical protein BU24DRAFT_483170 [Aaosphaeria arxii CBS 175.79]|uniref:Uncharacterized protein n=1 Tax=Aaosphaeria arxii CBS 175.79 TaxID=1450172 RepID=A0A6A5XKM1_9PLEO|nr:uncharacterized protein BU24DRAFT_483170 [Aaosphaeria arxii CBS 175.79]KAF2013426.1 hypothetical protein BU24DRAFT_483170 [Aaosphaeria arxii CBS 175.79]
MIPWITNLLSSRNSRVTNPQSLLHRANGGRVEKIHRRRQRKLPRRSSGLLDVSHQGLYTDIIEQNGRSPLLSLPAEIRNTIFAYALSDNIFRWDAHEKRHFIEGTGRNLFALLRTCRQIYAETAPIPFRGNTFEFCFDSFMEGHWQKLFKIWHLITSVHLVCPMIGLVYNPMWHGNLYLLEIWKFLPSLTQVKFVIDYWFDGKPRRLKGWTRCWQGWIIDHFVRNEQFLRERITDKHSDLNITTEWRIGFLGDRDVDLAYSGALIRESIEFDQFLLEASKSKK